jgi:hypothetical protein
MAFRTWARLLGATVGAAALAGAGQLGLAYGLGIIRLTRVLDVTTRDQWVAQLAWVAWIAMTSAAIGGMAGRRALPSGAGVGTRVLAAITAGIGAAIVVPLTMQPARTARIDGVHPVFVIGVCAALGAAAGIFAAWAVISQAVARWSVTTVGIAVWVLAVASVVPSLAPGGPLPAARLGVFDARFLSADLTRRTALFTMPLLALIGGVAMGLAARRRAPTKPAAPNPTVAKPALTKPAAPKPALTKPALPATAKPALTTPALTTPTLTTPAVALAGLAGPALLTLAYLVAGPGGGSAHYEVVPYWAAMIAAGAGVLGSVLVAVLGRDSSAESSDPRPRDRRPTPDRPPLPKRDAKASRSEIAAAAAAAAQRPDEQLRPSDTGVFTAPTQPNPVIHPTSIAPAPAPEPPGTPSFNGFAPAHSRPQPVVSPHAQPVDPQSINPTPQAPPTQRGRGRHNQQAGDEFVDWVSGLGNSEQR